MDILGLSFFYHDSAACLYRDGRVLACASEERFTRKKHDEGFPRQAIDYCLREGGLEPAALSAVGYYELTALKLERILETWADTFPRSFPSYLRTAPLWLRQKLWCQALIRQRLDYDGEVVSIPHHLSHAASAYYCSPFEQAAVLTADGVGEWATASLGAGSGNDLRLLREMRFPHSLGLLYSAFTQYLGFKVNSGECKVMGLAPYGRPRYVDRIYDELVRVYDDGSFELNLKYFDFLLGRQMINPAFCLLFGGPPRKKEEEAGERHADVAASIQQVTEDIVLRMARHLYALTGMKNLCLAGGVALNCVANRRLLEEGPFQDIFIQPAAGDAGGAVGVAAYIHHARGGARGQPLNDAYLGPGFDSPEIRAFLDREGAPRTEHEPAGLVRRVAGLLASGKVIGWFQGRMEFGPRALGNRSILADPRDPGMKDLVNAKIKFRERFRPFAPVVPWEAAREFFDIDRPSPYMLLTAPVRPQRRVIPAVTHVDGSARLQTVTREQNPLYHDLVVEFGRLTGVPVLLNTSFNVRGEPIVCTPAEAYQCFRFTDLDYLCLDRFLLDKAAMPPLPPDARPPRFEED